MCSRNEALGSAETARLHVALRACRNAAEQAPLYAGFSG